LLFDFKKIIYFGVLLGLLAISFLSSINPKVKNVIPEPVDISLVSIAIAITELETDENGYSGYRHVLESLQEQEGFKEYAKSHKKNIPYDIDFKKGVLAAKTIDANYKYYLDREDLGIVDYYKLSFLLFGYDTDSFIYLYYLLLFISLALFIARFFNNFEKLNLLAIFMISHWVIISVLPDMGKELMTVYNRRSLPILSMIPTIYIVISIFENKRLNTFGLAMLITQIAILMFIYHSRSSVSYQLLFIYSSFFLFCLFSIKKKFYYYLIKKSALISIVLISLSILGLKGYMYSAKDPQYSNYTSGHLFWHAAYIGLSAHPESLNKYGIYQDDSSSVNFVSSKTKKIYGTEDWESIGGHTLYEDILKKEYLSILINDPNYFLKNYIIKPYIFLKTFFASLYWSNSNIISITSILCSFAGGFFVYRSSLIALTKISLVLIGAFIFSMLPSLFVSTAVPVYILDPSVLFLTLIYWFLSLIIGFTIYTINIIYKKNIRV